MHCALEMHNLYCAMTVLMAIKNPIIVSVVLQIKFPSGLWYSFLSEMPFEFGWTKLNDLRSCFVVEVIKSHGLALTHVQVESHVKIFSIWNKSFSLKYIQFEHCSHCTDSWFSRITTHTHTHTHTHRVKSSSISVHFLLTCFLWLNTQSLLGHVVIFGRAFTEFKVFFHSLHLFVKKVFYDRGWFRPHAAGPLCS